MSSSSTMKDPKADFPLTNTQNQDELIAKAMDRLLGSMGAKGILGDKTQTTPMPTPSKMEVKVDPRKERIKKTILNNAKRQFIDSQAEGYAGRDVEKEKGIGPRRMIDNHLSPLQFGKSRRDLNKKMNLMRSTTGGWQQMWRMVTRNSIPQARQQLLPSPFSTIPGLHNPTQYGLNKKAHDTLKQVRRKKLRKLDMNMF